MESKIQLSLFLAFIFVFCLNYGIKTENAKPLNDDKLFVDNDRQKSDSLELKKIEILDNWENSFGYNYVKFEKISENN